MIAGRSASMTTKRRRSMAQRWVVLAFFGFYVVAPFVWMV